MAMTKLIYVSYFTALASRIKNYSVFCKFNPDLKCYSKQPPLHQTWLINSWPEYYVYGLTMYVIDNLNASTACMVQVPALMQNK